LQFALLFTVSRKTDDLDDFCFQMLVAFSVYEMTFELRRKWGTGDGDIGMGQWVWVGDGTIVVGMEWGWGWYRWGWR